VVRNRRWLRREWPFPHIVARDVFEHDFYQALECQLRQLLSRGLSDQPAPGIFSRDMPGYDAFGVGFVPSEEPSGIFLTHEWRDALCGLHGVGPTPYVFAGAHHHLAGSSSGFIHTDFNPVWFPRVPGDKIQVPNHALCEFKTGAGPLAQEDKVSVVRGAVAIFFLLNDGWQPGDGGEVGLFGAEDGNISDPDGVWEPINNSLVTFECTPGSFHAFIANHRLPRTSIIMWVHRTRAEAISRFGADRLEHWKT
jgi:hypothetical protein